MKIIVVIHNIRSTYNVGAILRTAEGFGVEKVVFSGYTPMYDDEKLLPHLRAKLNKEIHKTALGAEKMLNCERASDLTVELLQLKKMGWQIVGLENNIEKGEVYLLNGEELKRKAKDKIVLVLGEEVDGLNDELLGLADYLVEIPMYGCKESFNVSVAAGIALYGIMNL